jgi:hypothetical protein
LTKQLLSFKTDAEEKQELRDFKKFVQQITAPYFAQVDHILSRHLKVDTAQDNASFKGFIGLFNFHCQQIDSEAWLDYLKADKK